MRTPLGERDELTHPLSREKEVTHFIDHAAKGLFRKKHRRGSSNTLSTLTQAV